MMQQGLVAGWAYPIGHGFGIEQSVPLRDINASYVTFFPANDGTEMLAQFLGRDFGQTSVERIDYGKILNLEMNPRLPFLLPGSPQPLAELDWAGDMYQSSFFLY